MCGLCIEAEDLLEEQMAEEWDNLKKALFDSFMDGVKDAGDEIKNDAKAFFDQVATKAAKEKWYELKATTDSERELARSNLNHYRDATISETGRLALRGGEQARSIVKGVLRTGFSLLTKLAPALIAL